MVVEVIDSLPSTPMKYMFAAALLVAACGASQKDVSVQGTDLDLARVAGEWEGTYEGKDSGRSGPVTFSLRIGSHVAEGQVVMNGATPLKIEFVKIKADEVKGTIAPYTDPACSCQVETTFNGSVGDDTINGTFETKLGTTGQTQSGTWNVVRKKS